MSTIISLLCPPLALFSHPQCQLLQGCLSLIEDELQMIAISVGVAGISVGAIEVCTQCPDQYLMQCFTGCWHLSCFVSLFMHPEK